MAEENTHRLRELFRQLSNQVNLRGILGVTEYAPVYYALMPMQKTRLEQIVGDQHSGLMSNGFFVSLSYAYPDGIIDNISQVKDGVFDKESWNIYALWYDTLNKSLNMTTQKIAETLHGISLPATSTGMASKVTTVQEYYPTVVSHRVHAEQSGIGWRGKNSLIVNSRYSCMIRLAGVITSQPLVLTNKTDENCGSCTNCLEVCPFLRHRDKLDDYRQQCLAYMNWLSLDHEVCGKCIKACVYSPRFKENHREQQEPALTQLFYTTPKN